MTTAYRTETPPGTATICDVIVVARQSAPFLTANLPGAVALTRALARPGVDATLTVVDNASTDRSAAVARELAPGACVLELPANRGYGAALNVALRHARAEWALVANPDVDLTPLHARALEAALASAAPTDAVLAPAVLDADGRPQASVGPDPALGRLLLGLARARAARHYYRRTPAPGAVVDWATGACLLVRRPAWQAVSGFDEEFFLYYDDADFCRRVREAGFHVRFAPELRVRHLSPYHARPRSAWLDRVIMESRRRYFAKHRPAWESAVLGWLAHVERLVRRPSDEPAGAVRMGAGASTVGFAATGDRPAR